MTLHRRLCPTGLALAMIFVAACGSGSPAPTPDARAGGSGTTPAVPTKPPFEGLDVFASVPPTYGDLVYATVSPAQTLDLYLPASGTGPFAIVVIVHGGAFREGDKRWNDGLIGIDRLLAAGYAAASVNYRLSGEARYPAQIEDVKAAVRFLRANAGTYRLDPARFGAWGASAGGNLVSLLGTTCGIADLEGASLGNADQSSCVQAVVDWYGPIDFVAAEKQWAGTSCPQVPAGSDSPESQLVGAPLASVPDLVARTNPTNYIDASDPPFLIMHGTLDCTIPPAQSRNFADALRAVLGPAKVTFQQVEGAGHGEELFENHATLSVVIDFLDRNLKARG